MRRLLQIRCNDPMLKRLTILLIFATMLDEGVASPVPAPAKPMQPAKQGEDPPPAMAVPRMYRFESRGRRDPFVNPVRKPIVARLPASAVRPPGLRGVLLA